MKNANALALLRSSYANDEDSDSEGGSTENRTPQRKHVGITSTPATELPVPESLKNFLVDESDYSQNYDNQQFHNGRIRSFPHERGNWATCLYVPIQNDRTINILGNRILPFIESVCNFHYCDDFHVSLSKTVILRHHWIQLFINGVRSRIEKCKRFFLDFDNIEVFVNEERSRTFLALKVKLGHDMLLQLVKYVDENLLDFKLPLYYENPSFHTSILWCVGDKEKNLALLLPELQKQFNELKEQNPDIWSVNVTEIHCKTGNRLYRFKLC